MLYKIILVIFPKDIFQFEFLYWFFISSYLPLSSSFILSVLIYVEKRSNGTRITTPARTKKKQCSQIKWADKLKIRCCKSFIRFINALAQLKRAFAIFARKRIFLTFTYLYHLTSFSNQSHGMFYMVRLSRKFSGHIFFAKFEILQQQFV